MKTLPDVIHSVRARYLWSKSPSCTMGDWLIDPLIDSISVDQIAGRSSVASTANTVYQAYEDWIRDRVLPNPYTKNLRRRTRWQRPVRPPNRLSPQHKIQPPASRKHIVPLNPRPVPHLPVNLQTLHIVTIYLITARTSNQETLPFTQSDFQSLEPRRPDEEGCLASQRVQANHVPEDPCLHCTCVAVARDAGAVGAVVALCGVAGVFDAEVLAGDEVEEVGGVVAGWEGYLVFA